MEIVPLTLAPRKALGKKTRALRREGMTPVHVYGHGVQSQSLQAPTRPLIKALAKAGRATPLSITVEGGETQHLAFVREIQWHPVSGSLVHVDFFEVKAELEGRSGRVGVIHTPLADSTVVAVL